ncbi:response regulator [Paenibacillus andongensis]|uniref:response regulator n=1 Tax=Paenibacillus andongensis TaxID=2975482 RepID=UPI0021BB4649|nr:response regulator [Paenibacillus andongensis]
MYSILIVDDEVTAVSAVRSGVDWDKLSVRDVHVAYSVNQAKEVFNQHEIDVLICDIEMPQANGLELLTWVKEQYPSTESIFLTCHSDFVYAKKALQLGSIDYMLKPVRYHELEEVIQKATEKIEENREQRAFNESYMQYYNLWSVSQPILIERFWQDLFNRITPSNPHLIQEILEKQNIPYQKEQHFLPVLISVQRWYKELTMRDLKIMEYALRNAAEEMILKCYPNSQIIHIKNGTLLALLSNDLLQGMGFEPNELKKELELYIASCNRYFYCDLSCYIGKPMKIWEIVSSVDLLLQMETNNVTQNNKVFAANETTKNQESMNIISMDSWLELLKQGAYEAIFHETESYLNTWRQIPGLDARLLIEFHQSFTQILYHFIQVKGLQAHDVLTEHISAEQMAAAVRSVTDLQNWVKVSLQQAVNYCRTLEEKETVTDKVKWYIKQHLGQDISREDIAKHVHLHPDYLSRFFKKETGKSLVDYIFEERIHIAKELLAKTDMSVSGIAISIGYSNFSYFAKMFKRATQMNPQEFREYITSSHQSTSRP